MEHEELDHDEYCDTCYFSQGIEIINNLIDHRHPSELTGTLTDEGLLAVLNAIDYLSAIAYGHDLEGEEEM